MGPLIAAAQRQFASVATIYLATRKIVHCLGMNFGTDFVRNKRGTLGRKNGGLVGKIFPVYFHTRIALDLLSPLSSNSG